jgi:hypothetical protein
MQCFSFFFLPYFMSQQRSSTFVTRLVALPLVWYQPLVVGVDLLREKNIINWLVMLVRYERK